MGRTSLAALLACLLTAVGAPAAHADVFDSLGSESAGATPASGQYLVKFAAGTSAAEQAAALAEAGAEDLAYTAALRLHSVRIADDTEAALDELRANPVVARVESEQTRAATAVPSDTGFASQWSLPRIGWDEVFGSVAPGGAATVALLDTGVAGGHPDLAGSVVPGTSVIDPEASGSSDPNGHGTAMAGIVAASTDNGEGVAGIGYAGVNVMPVTVLDAHGVGSDGDIIAGVVWAADHGADVILMAFSSPDFSPSLQEAIDYAWARGAVLVAAAGNDGSSSAHFPAGDRGVVGVANTDESDALEASSNYGAGAFLAAPGTGIYTTASDGGYGNVSGTSASAAAVAGAAGLLKAVSPQASNGTVVGRLARSADPTVGYGAGNGRLNLARALEDPSAEEVQPAGAAPVGEGGPVVGPYTAAAATSSRVTAGNWNAATTWTGSSRTGTITASTSSGVVNGVGTAFLTELAPGDALYTSNGTTLIGTVHSIATNTQLTLTTNAQTAITNGVYTASRVPTVDDSVTITGGHAVTIPAGYAASAASVTINPAGTNAATLLALAAGTSSLTTAGGVTLNRPLGSSSTTLNVGAGSLAVGGNLTLDGVTTQGNRLNRVAIGTGSVDVAGDLVYVTGNVSSNVVDMSPGGLTGGTLTLRGAFTVNGGSALGSLNGANGTVDFRGTGAQTIPVATGVNYPHLHVNNTSAGGATLGGIVNATNVTGDLRVQTGTFDNGGFSITGGGGTDDFVVADGATFRLGANSSLPTGFTTRVFGDTSTVDFAGATQTVGPMVGAETFGHLRLSGTGTKTASGGLSIRGNFTNDVTAATTFAAGSTTTTFTGPAATQTIGGANATTFNGLVISKASGGVTLARDATVSTLLTLTNGNVTTGANTLSVVGSVARASGHVVGNLRRRVVAGSPTVPFDIGSASSYTPVSLAFSGVTTAGDVTASTTGTEHPNIATSGIHSGKSVNRYWSLARSGGLVFGSYNATFTFVAGDVDGGAATANFIVKRHDGTNWNATTAGTRLATSTQATGVTGMSDFAVGEADAAGPVTTATDVSPTPTSTAPTATASVSDATTGGGNLTAAEYFVDSVGAAGSGTAMAASDGTFDSPAESVTGTLTSPQFSGLSQGTHTVHVRGRDLAGNWGATDSDTFVKDTIGPDTAIAFPVDGRVYNVAGWNAGCPSAGLCGTASDATTAVASVEVSIERESDGAYWNGTAFGGTSETYVDASGTTSWSYALAAGELTDGESYTVHAKGTDTVGNVSSVASASFTIDATPPAVTVDEAGGQDDPTNAQPIHFTAEFSEPVTGFDEDDVDLSGTAVAGAIVDVTPGTGNTYDISVSGLTSDGTVVVDVPAGGAEDSAGNGNTASTSTDNEVLYDATDPASQATSPEFSNASAATIPVDYTASDAGGSGLAKVELWAKKDDGAFALADTDTTPNATRQFAYTPSGDGTYRFYTVAEDSAGNREDAPSAADTTTLRDTVAPAPALTSPPAFTNDPTPEIAGTAGTQAADGSHSADEGTVTVEILDDTDTVVQTHAAVPVSAGAFSVDATHLADGDYTARVTQSDAAGNSDSDERDFTVDTAAPAPPTVTDGPDDPTNETTADFEFTAAESGGTLQCKLDSGPYEDCTSPRQYTGLAEGGHDFSVRQVDAAGNEGDPDTHSWFVDLTAPVTTIDDTPSDPDNDATPTFEFSGTDTHSGASALTFECQVDGGAWESCTSPNTLSALLDGDHTFRVRATDEAGNTDATPAEFSWTLDTVRPASEASAPATTNETAATFDVDYTASDERSGLAKVELYASKNGGTYALANTDSSPSASGTFGFTHSGDGTYRFYTIATDNAGNEERKPTEADEVTIVEDAKTVRDTVAPDVTMNAPPASTNDPTPAIAGTAGTQAAQDDATADDDHVTVRVLDDTDTVVQTHSNVAVNPSTGAFSVSADHLADGDYTARASQTDGAGNSDSDERDFTVDTVAPAAPTITDGPDDPTNETTADLTFTAAESGGTLQCKLDDGSYETCTSPKQYTGVPAGGHTFSVRQVDAAGNEGAADTHDWFVDLTEPETSIDATPSDPSNDATPTFEFSGTDTHSPAEALTFECKVDDGDWADCSSPKTLAALLDGDHTFRARATDEAGNTDSTPDEFQWALDTVKPVSQANAPATTNDTDPTFDVAYTASDERSGLDKVELYASKNGGAYSLANTDNTPSASGTFAFTHSGDGTYRFYTIATDDAGNVEKAPTEADEITIVEDARTVRDTAAPDVTLNAPPAFTNDATPAIAGTAGIQAAQDDATADDGTVTVRVLDDTDTVIQTKTAAVNATTGAFTVDADHLADGDYTARASQSDGAGNSDTAEREFTVDTDAPDAPTITDNPDDPTRAATAQFAFTAAESGGTLECKLDSGSYEACTSPKDYTGLAEGSHTFSVRQVDAAGNESAADTFTWFVDLTEPGTQITDQPDDPSNDDTPTFEFTGTDNHSAPGSLTFECQVDGLGWSSCSSPETLAALSDDSHTFEVRATDQAGNTDGTPASYTWTVDTEGPAAPTITADPGTLTNSDSATFEWTAAEPGGHFECKLDAADFSHCSSPEPYAALSEGHHKFSVRQVDAAGNAGTVAEHEWDVDRTEPNTTIDSQPPNPDNDPTPPFEFSGTDNHSAAADLDFECNVDDLGWNPCSSPETLAALTDGSHDFEVRATDEAGNVESTPASHTWTIDTDTPAAPAITSPAEGSLHNSASITLQGTAEAGATVEVFEGATSRGTATANGSGDWSKTLTGVSDGSHTYTAKATDAAGNTSGESAGRTIVVDTAKPQSQASAPATSSTAAITVTYTASDSAGGSGLAKVELWAKAPSAAAFTLAGTDTTPNATQSFGYTAAAGDGSYSFYTRAYDLAGNVEDAPATPDASTAVSTAPVFAFSGFKAPVDNLPTVNQARAGSNIPLKFGLGGDRGMNIFAEDYPKSQAVPCNSSAPVDGIEETGTPGNSALTYDAATQIYHYNWKTEKGWTGCRQLVIKFVDGSYARANFKFVK